MKPLAIVTTVLSLVFAAGSVKILTKFGAIHRDMGLAPSGFTRLVTDSAGWLVGGPFLALAASMIYLLTDRRDRMAAFVAIGTLALIVTTAFLLTLLAFRPLTDVIRVNHP